jgi:hypothetical protein
MTEISPKMFAQLQRESAKHVETVLGKLEAAMTNTPLPGKTKAPPRKAAWEQFVLRAQAELNFGLKTFEHSVLRAFGERFGVATSSHEAARAAISEVLLVPQPALLPVYADKVGIAHPEIALYDRGFGALMLASRLLREMGLESDGRRVAYAAYVEFRDLAQRFDGPGPNLVAELGKALSAGLLARVGWPDVQAWALEDYARVKLKGASNVPAPAV